MKRLLLTLCLSLPLLGGNLTDSANLFGPDHSKVSAAIENLPIWVETFVQTPPGGLKPYADARVVAFTQRGFLIVITTQPRQWRVSMTPIGIASSEGVRMAGDTMVASFMKGKIAEGMINFTAELMRLSESKVIQAEVGGIPEQSHFSDRMGWIIVGALIGLTVIGVLWLNWRSDRKEESLRKARETKPVTKSTPNPEEARRVFDSYTPSQREALISLHHHHHCSSGASTDPMLFWMMMNMSQPSYPTSTYSASLAPEPRRHDSSSSNSSSYSSSDSSSSSFDSGSSSFDSGSSSSDSSGAVGSW
jgi:uncharacterized membrane protein YgcG